MLNTDVLKKLNDKYVGKNVEMFSNNWYAEIRNIDELGWTFVITKPYTATGHQKKGDIIFYSHNDKLNFRIVDN
jgi:hypothetical protein